MQFDANIILSKIGINSSVVICGQGTMTFGVVEVGVQARENQFFDDVIQWTAVEIIEDRTSPHMNR